MTSRPWAAAPAGHPSRTASAGCRRTGPWRRTRTARRPLTDAMRALSEPSTCSQAPMRRDDGIGCSPARCLMTGVIGRRPRAPRAGAAPSQGEGAPDEDLLHLGRAFVDLAHADVAVDALDREVGRVAVAPEHLDRRRADVLGHLAG